MILLRASGSPVSVQLEAQITRADGTVEDPKVVAYWHRNRLMRLLARVRGVKGKVTPSCA